MSCFRWVLFWPVRCLFPPPRRIPISVVSSSAAWTNVEYNDGVCHYYYSYNSYDQNMKLNRYGDCSHVAIGPDGNPTPVYAGPVVVRQRPTPRKRAAPLSKVAELDYRTTLQIMSAPGGCGRRAPKEVFGFWTRSGHRALTFAVLPDRMWTRSLREIAPEVLTVVLRLEVFFSCRLVAQRWSSGIWPPALPNLSAIF